MPYVSEKIKIAGTKNDRRRKLSEADKEEIRTLYSSTVPSQRKLAAIYKVSRRLIQFIIDPAKEAQSKENFKKWKQSSAAHKPSKEEWAATMREHRHYKQELYLKKEIE